MVSDTLEQRIYELVRSHDGIYLFKKKELTPSTDLDLKDFEAVDSFHGEHPGVMSENYSLDNMSHK